MNRNLNSSQTSSKEYQPHFQIEKTKIQQLKPSIGVNNPKSKVVGLDLVSFLPYASL
jgi:hypothetical protein